MAFGRKPKLRKPAFVPPPIVTPATALSALRPAAARSDRLTVRTGRHRVGVISTEDAARLGLHEGMAWTENLAARISAAAERLAVRDAALRLLGRRGLSRLELSRKLQQKGFARPDAEAAVAQMVRLGLIDEAAMAAALVRGELQRRPAGARLLEAKLARRGLDRAASKRAVQEATAARSADDDALELARRRAARMKPGPDSRADLRRLAGLLARRGFDAGVAFNAARRALAERGATAAAGDADLPPPEYA